jgi:Flp pilus assembly protein TadB
MSDLTTPHPEKAPFPEGSGASLLDAVNHLHETMGLQEAAFMAAGAVNCAKQGNALSTIIDHVSTRLAELEGMLSAIRRRS